MDPRPTVGPTESGPETVFAEQCVFTSIRSPFGRGYRIVAASAGLAADEKREIVQRAPSHGSICDPSPHGRGLASFTLQTGRRCLFLAQNAGVEHSGRGDYRVHTHVLVINPAGYRSLGCDPLGIEATAQTALGADWLRDPPPQNLARLLLGDGAAAGNPGLANMSLPSADELRGLTAVLSHVLAGVPLVVTGITNPRQAFAWLWTAVPGAVRDALSLSCGLRFAPGRSFRLVVTEAAPGEARRIGIDHNLDVVEWNSPAEPSAPHFDQWLSFAQRRWAAGRFADLDRLSAELVDAAAAPDLAHIVALSDDMDRLRDADLALVNELTARHAVVGSKSGACARLHEEFHRTAAIRQEQLRQADTDAVDANDGQAPGLAGATPGDQTAERTPSSGGVHRA